MLWYPVIPLAYILSLPSLHQPANRWKELQLSLCHVPLSKQKRMLCVSVCKLLAVGTDVKVDTGWETWSNTHGLICTHSQTWLTALSGIRWSCCSTTIDFRLLHQDPLLLYHWAPNGSGMSLRGGEVDTAPGWVSFGFMTPYQCLLHINDVRLLGTYQPANTSYHCVWQACTWAQSTRIS